MLVYTDSTNINTKLSDDSLDTRTLIKLAKMEISTSVWYVFIHVYLYP